MNLVWRFAYRIYRLFSWARYSVRRRLTPSGTMIACALVVAAVMGPDTENTVAYQGFTSLFCLLALAFVFSWVFRARFSATRLLPRFGTVGCAMQYTMVLKNLSSKRQAGLDLLDDLTDTRPSFADWRAMQVADERRLRSFRVSRPRRKHPFRVAELKEATVAPVAPGQEVEVRLQLTPLRRGLLHFSGFTLARRDPLGIYRALARTKLPQSALILPKRYSLPPVALPGSLKYQEGGVALASHVGQSEEFVALRDYRYGDPLRHIHWRSWAKVGKPVIKEYEDEFFVRHALLLDTFDDDPDTDVFEEAVSVAASFACTILTQESLLDLLFVGTESYCFTAGRGLGRAEQMLEILASVRPCMAQGFDSLEHLVLNHIGGVSGCICVLLKWDEARKQLIEKLNALGVPLLVLLVAPAGSAAPRDARVAIGQFRMLETGQIEQGLAKLT